MSDEAPENKMREGLTIFATKVKQVHDTLGYWDEATGLDDLDLPNVVAAIHKDVSKIYEAITHGGDMREISYIDPTTGELTEPGKGVPSGLAVEVAEVIFDCMGLLRGLGLDAGKVLGDIAEAQILSSQFDGVDMESVLGEGEPSTGEPG